jgi:hypothetical protein
MLKLSSTFNKKRMFATLRLKDKKRFYLLEELFNNLEEQEVLWVDKTILANKIIQEVFNNSIDLNKFAYYKDKFIQPLLKKRVIIEDINLSNDYQIITITKKLYLYNYNEVLKLFLLLQKKIEFKKVLS